METLEQIGIKAKKASRYLAKLGIDEKNKALEAVADALIANAESIIAANEKESGATVHYVTSGIDEGEIILQGKFEIAENETPESLAQKVHEIEYEIFPKAIAKILAE